MFIPISDRDLTHRSFPIVNISIIAVCAIVFFYELATGNNGVFFYKFGLIPYELTHGIEAKFICGPYIYSEAPPQFLSSTCVDIASPIPTWATMFTAMFVHGGWMHFLGNMVFLWVFGDNIEDRFGHLGYLIFYLASGAGAFALQIALDTNSVAPTIGASGAIAGVLGAYVLLYPYSRVDTLVFIMIIRIPAVLLLGFWFLLQFFSGLGDLGPSAQTSGVAYWAHVGGFFVGVMVVIVYKLIKGERIWPGGSGGNGGGDGYGQPPKSSTGEADPLTTDLPSRIAD